MRAGLSGFSSLLLSICLSGELGLVCGVGHEVGFEVGWLDGCVGGWLVGCARALDRTIVLAYVLCGGEVLVYSMDFESSIVIMICEPAIYHSLFLLPIGGRGS